VRVLVVDDGEDVREVVSAVLAQRGAEVQAVGTPAEALEAMARFAPHVLVSEVEMRGETGFSLIQKVRALPADHGGMVPAAALSAYGRTDDRVQALLAGFQIHVPKPVQPTELVAVVASLAGRTPGRVQALAARNPDHAGPVRARTTARRPFASEVQAP
jgi:CheY-like chemotaxis protein